MSFTYKPERGDAVSRVRSHVGDKAESGARWTDEDIRLALTETKLDDALYLQYDTTADPDADAATAQVRDAAGTVELVLTVTTGPHAGTVPIDLVHDDRYDRVHELIDAVAALTPPWSIGYEWYDRILWVPRSPSGWPGVVERSSLQLRELLERQVSDLALTNGALDALGPNNRRRLALYQPKKAARKLLREALLALNSYDHVTAGDVTLIRTTLTDRMRLLGETVAVGVSL